jgi:hypothetical protein
MRLGTVVLAGLKRGVRCINGGIPLLRVTAGRMPARRDGLEAHPPARFPARFPACVFGVLAQIGGPCL